MDEASAEGEPVLWVGMTVYHERQKEKKSAVDENCTRVKCIARKRIHFSVLNVKMQIKIKSASFVFNQCN